MFRHILKLLKLQKYQTVFQALFAE